MSRDEDQPEAIDIGDLLHSIWLHVDWRYVTKQLTTDQKEFFADSVEAFSHRANEGAPGEPLSMDRWWRS